MVEFVNNLGELLRTARKECGLSQEAVAYRVGLEQTDISKIERGREKPSSDQLRRIAEVLGLSENELVK